MQSLTIEHLANRADVALADAFDRSQIFSILFTRIAAGAEVDELGWRTTGVIDDEEAWTTANRHLSEIVEIDSERAFQVAIKMTLLPTGDSDSQELINKWIRTSGLTLLGLSDNAERLAYYLEENDENNLLREILLRNISESLIRFDTPDTFHDPQGFTTLQCIYIGLNLRDKGGVSNLIYDIASRVTLKNEIQQAASIVATFGGCEHINKLINK